MVTVYPKHIWKCTFSVYAYWVRMNLEISTDPVKIQGDFTENEREDSVSGEIFVRYPYSKPDRRVRKPGKYYRLPTWFFSTLSKNKKIKKTIRNIECPVAVVAVEYSRTTARLFRRH